MGARLAPSEKPDDAGSSAVIAKDVHQSERSHSTELGEAIHKALLESTSEFVFLWGINREGIPGKILHANAAACAALGYTREEFLALSPMDVIPPEDLSDAASALVEFASKGELLVERTLLTKSGGRLLVEAHGSLLEVGGELTALVACRDLSARSDAVRAVRKEQQRAQRYLDIAGVMIVALDMEGDITLVNRKACDVLGYPESELLGMNWFETFLPEWTLERRPTVEAWLQTRGNDEARSPGSSLITRTGEERTILWRNTELMDECGNVVGILGSGTDVTERTRVEDALAESELMTRSLLEGSPICTKIIGTDRKLHYMSAAGINALGICDIKPYYEQTYPLDFYPESIRATLEDKLTLALSGEACTVDAPVHTMDGAELWFQTTFVPVLDDEGTVKHVIAASVDINERRRAEEALGKITRLLTQAELIAGAGSWERDLRTNAMTWSKPLFPLFGIEPQEPTLELLRSFVHPEDVGWWESYFGEKIEQNTGPFSVEYRIIRTDGVVAWLRVAADVIRDEHGAPVKLVGMTRDITERKRAEVALRESEERLRLVFEGSRELIAVSGEDLRPVWANPAWEDVFGPISEQATVPMSCTHPDDVGRMSAAWDSLLAGRQEAVDLEYRSEIPGRGTRHFDARAFRVTLGGEERICVIARDITDRKASEESLRLSERSLRDALAEIGHLKELLEAENVYLREAMRASPLHGVVVAECPAMRAVMQQAGRVGVTSSTVLITGETGTGKELLARAIHETSPRRDRPFVVVNCAAMPETLVESELFGREKGAFTGAVTRQIGRFEVADGSTIFLDEIGELPLGTQAKLLRVLEQGQIERLGSTRTIDVDVRVIVATNKNLEQATLDGSFRQDLFYRLNVFPIHVPPLRERREDIPALVAVFVEEFSTRMGRRIDTVPKECMDELIEYPWPGNIRELRNLIERAMIRGHGTELHVELPKIDLTPESRSSGAAKLSEVERDHILSGT